MVKKRDYSKDYQTRPARIQLDYKDTQKADIVGGTYNIWYSKWQGEGKDFGKGVDQSKHRCIIERDAGRTRASAKMPFCIHFAHGTCSRGPNCTFLHRLPLNDDRVETTLDCFGRDKFRNNRDDMGGVGSFENRVRTLYVGNVGINDHMEEICRAHFGEWGEIEHINVLQSKGVAFIQYRNLLNAEFAKEAMQGQTLESSEIVNVRWANEDPNPGVREELKRKAEQTVIDAITSKLPIVGEKGTILDYETQLQNRQPKLKKKKVENTLYEDDQDEWATYCEQYKQTHGSYPDGYEPSVPVETASSIYMVANKTTAKPNCLVDYPSSEED